MGQGGGGVQVQHIQLTQQLTLLQPPHHHCRHSRTIAKLMLQGRPQFESNLTPNLELCGWQQLQHS